MTASYMFANKTINPTTWVELQQASAEGALICTKVDENIYKLETIEDRAFCFVYADEAAQFSNPFHSQQEAEDGLARYLRYLSQEHEELKPMGKVDHLLKKIKEGNCEQTQRGLKNDVVVVLSGGQDSTTCLGLALQMYDHVTAVAFSYGQKHAVELQCASMICRKFGVPLHVFEIPALRSLGNSALVSGSEQTDVNEKHSQNANLPASFVPNRNALFLTTAHALAQKVGAHFVMTGVCETDYSGYPDCRQGFVNQLQSALNVGYETDIEFVTPLMHLTKAETFELAEKVGILETVIKDTHTCYNGDHSTSHDWGYGCGHCPACNLREAGYKEYASNK